MLWSIFVRDYDPTLQKLVAHPDFLPLRKKCLEMFGLGRLFRNSFVFRRWYCQVLGRIPKEWKAIAPQVSTLAQEFEARPMQMLKAPLIRNYDPLGTTSLLFPLDAWDPKPRLAVHQRHQFKVFYLRWRRPVVHPGPADIQQVTLADQG